MGPQDAVSKRIDLELEWLWKFGYSLKSDDKPAFLDMVERLSRSEFYKLLAGSLESPVRQMPLILSILFLHEKMLAQLARRIMQTGSDGERSAGV